MNYTVYIVDDEPGLCESIAFSLRDDYRVLSFESAEAAIAAIPESPPHLILLDIGLPGMSGLDAIGKIQKLAPYARIIMITAFEDVDSVVSAVKSGACDYVVKPLQMEALAVKIAESLESLKIRDEIRTFQENYLKTNMPFFIGESKTILDVMEIVEKVAQSPDTSILILGETGTGKELIANAIHCRSPNAKGKLVAVNCAAIPAELIESELFGYEKGAFSGALSTGKVGLVEQAENGTLFLDEVGDLSPEAQSKLLRFLENGEYYRVGGVKKRRVRTRLVSATNKEIERMAAGGRFRKDLYYRLAVVKVAVPSLNRRREDILPIADAFLRTFSGKFGKSIAGISPSARNALHCHDWEGNVRELRNVMERAVLMADGPELGPGDLGLSECFVGEDETGTVPIRHFPSLQEEGMDLPAFQESLEKHYFKEALRLADGNESHAARLLQISRATFRYRKQRLHID